MRSKASVAAAAALSAFAARAAAQPTVEVLHFWTSGTEARAIKAVQADFEKAGGLWIDVPVPTGKALQQILESRVISGAPPSAVVLHTEDSLRAWEKEGLLADVDDVAQADHWDEHLPRSVAERRKYRGKYVAVPIDVHRFGMVFANAAVLRKAGVRVDARWPRDWAAFDAAAAAIAKTGAIPVAHGGTPWQDYWVFQAIALGLGGRPFYQKAFDDLDLPTLSSPTMLDAFKELRRFRGYSSSGVPGNWDQSAEKVIRGEAGMMVLADSVKGAFLAAGKKPDADFLCVPSPGTAGMFPWIQDFFIMFKTKDPDRVAGQKLLARVMMSERTQVRFSLAKGSIPARLGVNEAAFDACGRRAIEDFARADAAGTAFPAMGTASAATRETFTDAVSQQFQSNAAPEEGVEALTGAAQNEK